VLEPPGSLVVDDGGGVGHVLIVAPDGAGTGLRRRMPDADRPADRTAQPAITQKIAG
jgi:hypothetical protein